uniref:uncharacterized protein isoform X2 n=1 Tax=Myxine glutinosa TaxID=7769 RepID=UPI00358F298C
MLHVLPRVRDLFWPSSSCRSSSLCHKIEDKSTSGAMYTDEQIFSILSMNSTMRHQIREKEQQLLNLRRQVQVVSGRLIQLLGGENNLAGGEQRAYDRNDERTTYGKTSCEEQKIESMEDQCNEEKKKTKNGEHDLVFKLLRGIDDEVAIPGYIVREQGVDGLHRIDTQREVEEMAGLIRNENQEGFVEELDSFSINGEGEDCNTGINETSDCKNLEELSEDVMIKMNDGDEKEGVKHEELRKLIEEVCEKLGQLGESENKGSICVRQVRGVGRLRETREKTQMKVQDPNKENCWETNSSDSSSSFSYETPFYPHTPHPNFQHRPVPHRPLSPHPSTLLSEYCSSSSQNILTPPYHHLSLQICPRCRNPNPSHVPLSWEGYHESNSSDLVSSTEDELAFHLPQAATFV